MDWNWFFSSLSQSAAAITGIFGAFIITKIFSNQTVYLEKRNRIKSAISQAQKISDDAEEVDISWYSKTIDDKAFRKLSKYLQKEFKGTEPSEFTESNHTHFLEECEFSIFTPKDVIADFIRRMVIAACERNKIEIEKQRNAAKSKSSNSLFGLSTGSIIIESSRDILMPDVLPWPKLEEVSDRIKALRREAKHHIRVVADLLDSVQGNPESPAQITYSLLFVSVIFFTGVIYPLSFMPMGETASPELDFSAGAIWAAIYSFKGLLLAVLTLAFLSVMIVFARSNLGMKYSKPQIEELQHLTILENYSPHFQFLQNEKD